jgi:CBS domain-containing protein
MTHILQIILDDTSFLPDLLQVWREIGVSGTTIIKSVGGYRTSSWLSKVGLGAIDKIFDNKEIQRRTLIAIIEEDELLEQAIAEAERVVGGFDRPNSGVLMVLPVTMTKGLYKADPKPPQVQSPPALLPNWMMLRDTPIEQVDDIMQLEPTIVDTKATLTEVAQEMLTHPSVHVACVVAEDGRLVGLISLKTLADDLFFHILPEEFIAEITDIEKTLSFADKTRILTAEDAMSSPVWVKCGETVKDAFKRIHDNDLPGLPVVNDTYHVIGYINLLELISLCQNNQKDASSSRGQK